MGDKGKKDKGKREQQKKAQLSSKEKRKLKKEKQSFASNRHVEENRNPIAWGEVMLDTWMPSV